ncbi:fibro-slime domain-containing protein [Agathobacter rectalis]|uniref:DUF7601 domain-containing protein n=1 Tax=Agathobacter rectalis TaxID=39491 RepID=UPI0022048A10|nr:fibro-slime domain-containing protein [Agathobacter rectalis]UTB43723.1 fibro-slime domain-containing protein [Agathobacter rectalis]
MRKKFKKRLLGIILTILMVVSVIPVQQVQPVKAAAGDTIPAGTTIYLRPNAATTWIKDNAVMAFKTSANNKQSEIVVMTKMDDCLTWYGTTTAAATNIDFLRLNPNDTNQVWNEAGTWPGLESGKNLYTFVLHTGVTPTGMWTTYSNTGSETTSYFNVNATLVDYFNNGRVEQPKNTLYNEGNMTGEKNAPYAKLNQWLSNLPGYALNGVDSTDNVNAPVPLYFGDLLHTSQAGGNGNLSWYWKGANVAFGPNKETASKDVAQGIVGKNLDDGNLITSYTNENGDPVKVPFFNEDAYPNQSKYMRFYNNLQFPFTKKTNDKGVSTYSFDSEQNTVHYDYENNKIVRDDTIKIHDVDGDTGYFPFNSVEPSAKDNLNYGFGTQFTIPFTVTETGKNVDGTSMTFKFTGDDDVWVYIDGALVLDMGGAHCKAEGEINFATQMATITTGTSDAKLGNQPTAGGRVAAKDNGNRTVDFKNITVTKSDGKTISLADYMKESGKVHELKMYYMERGMWDSNMSISYSFVPLPSGLTLSKTLDTTDVNAGLKNAVQGLDNFDFKIQKKNLKTDEANYSDVENLGYTLYDYDDRTFPGQEAKDSTATFSSSYFASDFINTKDKNNSSAFYAGTGFQITESIPQGTKLQYDTSKTRWGVYDSITSRAAIEGGKGAVATFNMGDDTSSEMDVVNRYVNFVNTPKVGSLSVAKKYEGYAPENETFGFTVLVDLTGHDYYDSYKLEYTGTQNGTTDENGHFTLKVGDTVTFAGIPAGATYKVVEDSPQAGDTWVQETTSDVTGKIEADVTSAAVVTNKTKTTVKDYVIYAEAGKTVTYAPDGVTITELTAQTTGDKDITTNVNKDGKGEFTPTSSNKKYDVNYEGTTTDKGIFAGKITVLTYEATNKVYVFDYGLESNIADTTTGDGLFQGGIFYNEKATGTMATTAKLGEITPAQENSQTTISGSNIEIDKDGKAASAVTFKPIAFMDKAENYKYTANIAKVSTELDDTNPETGTTVHGTIKTMPANVVYYEDNFNASNNTDDSSVKIVYTNLKPTNDPTYSQSNDQSENYGHDKAYNGDLEESGNSATEMNNGDGAYFTFTGDGFDIVSRTNENTAGLIAYVYNGKKDAEYFRNPEVFKAGTKDLVKSIPVDTFYSNGDLYQVPVISTTLQQRGTYTVYLKALKTYTGQSVIYIDGVRIYNPLADKSAYLETEKNTKVQELRGMLLGSSPSINLVTPDGNNGFLIDGGSTAVEQYLPEKPEIGAYLGAETLADVMKAGPNNELYLPIDNGVAFKVSTPVGDADWTLQVGAKSVSADTSTESDAVVADKAFTVYVKPDDVKETKYQEVKNYTINTSTDMYYDINLKEVIKAQGWTADSYDVIVLNTTVDYNNYDIISLTNIKCAADMTLSKPSQLTRMGYNLAGRNVLTGNDEAVLSAKFGVTNVTRGKYASMTVVTKKEATDVQVTDPTGAVVTSFTKKTSSIDADGNKEWKLTFKVIKQRGEAKYSVDAVVNGSLTNMPYSTSIMVR